MILGGKNAAIVGNETFGNQDFGIASTGDNTLVLNNGLIENGPETEGERGTETEAEDARPTPGNVANEQVGNSVVIGTRILRNRLPAIVLSRRNTFV